MKRILLPVITLLLSTNSFASSIDAGPIQKMLQSYGYYSGPIDRIVSPELRNALILYANDKEACPTNLDPKTCRLLMEFQRNYL